MEVPTNILVQKGLNNQATLVLDEPRSLHDHELSRFITRTQSHLQNEHMWFTEKLARLKLKIPYSLLIFAITNFQTLAS